MKFFVEPLSHEQTDKHTQPKLETYRSIGAEIFQIVLQMTVPSVAGIRRKAWFELSCAVGVGQRRFGPSMDAMLVA